MKRSVFRCVGWYESTSALRLDARQYRIRRLLSVTSDLAYRVAMGFLTADQYEHAASCVKDLAQHDDPTHSETQRVEGIDSYFELKDKGGILGKINLRVFFYVDKPLSAIIVLGAINKSAEGQTPRAVKIRMHRRLRKYLNNEWLFPESS